MDSSRISHISAFIIAGGRSLRFGQDKTLFVYRGRPLIEHVFGAVSSVFRDVAVVANEGSRFASLGVPCYPDLVDGAGPMGGIYTALRHAATGKAFIVAGDMPDLDRGLIRYLADISGESDITVPFVNDRHETLHAIYAARCADELEPLIAKRHFSMNRYLHGRDARRVGIDEIARFADPATAFRNINFIRDLDG